MSDDQERSYFDEFIASPKNWVVYEQERLAEDIGEFVLDRLDVMDVPQVALAKCLNKSPAVVSRLLSKGSNMTLRTIVELVAAVGYQVELKLDPIPAAVAGWWLGDEAAPVVRMRQTYAPSEEAASAGLKAYSEYALSPAEATYAESLAFAS